MSTPTNITTFVIDDRDPRIRYIGTDWGTLGNAEVECNGTTHLTWTKGSSFSFSYNGNAMRSSVTPLSGEMHMAADTYVLPLQALASYWVKYCAIERGDTLTNAQHTLVVSLEEGVPYHEVFFLDYITYNFEQSAGSPQTKLLAAPLKGGKDDTVTQSLTIEIRRAWRTRAAGKRRKAVSTPLQQGLRLERALRVEAFRSTPPSAALFQSSLLDGRQPSGSIHPSPVNSAQRIPSHYSRFNSTLTPTTIGPSILPLSQSHIKVYDWRQDVTGNFTLDIEYAAGTAEFALNYVLCEVPAAMATQISRRVELNDIPSPSSSDAAAEEPTSTSTGGEGTAEPTAVTTDSNRSSKRTIPAGMITGIVMGVTALIAAVCLLAVLHRKQKRRRVRYDQEMAATPARLLLSRNEFVIGKPPSALPPPYQEQETQSFPESNPSGIKKLPRLRIP
ncbi:hypothetical protein BDV98DRAFT_583657 [Pterulicium gracile]|uniref:Uncharacterized protein n=1 Tax=Pterulicium gracile TaxID=1884261 RepID=A0A5C3QD76_9AGAR|nr:hypothetical protein BDV98DRAFT_583657 [Pterula gracilis]